MKIRTPRGPRRSTREAILDTATVVLTGSPNASMATLAQASGVSRATLYRHFPSREELVKEISLEAIRLTDNATAPVFEHYQDAEQALREMIEALIPFGDRYHFLANENQAGADPKVADESRRQLSELAEFVDQAKQEGFFAEDLPTRWIVVTIDSAIWTAWHSIHRGILAPSDAAQLVYRTLVDGLRRR